MNERYQYILTSQDEELPIKELLKRRMAISSRLLRKLKADKGVYLDGKGIKLYEKGKKGSIISIRLPDESSDFPPQDIAIDIIYEDQDLLVINKQAGLVVHPTKGHPDNTIANGIMNHMIHKGERYKIRFINRLDMNTSGVLLVGKNSHCQDNFTKQATSGKVEKSYLALVKGIVEDCKGTIDQPIAKADEKGIRRIVISSGYESVTHYQVIERFDKGFTLLLVRLETGRTHQIRVHLSHLGHPIEGDDLYGEPSELIGRQALHAYELCFQHPIRKESLSCYAPIPPDIERLLSKIRQDS